MIRITRGDLGDPRVLELLRSHVSLARAETAPGSAHALDVVDLETSEIRFFTMWDGETVAGVGALKRLSAGHGEVKSMFVTPAMRGRGTGGAMLRHIIATTKAANLARLSLETGASDYFRPARALYRSHGFEACAPFADYVTDPHSVFMSLDLGGARARVSGSDD